MFQIDIKPSTKPAVPHIPAVPYVPYTSRYSFTCVQELYIYFIRISILFHDSYMKKYSSNVQITTITCYKFQV